MKTPVAALNFNQQTWYAKAKQHQRLQADLIAVCASLGVMQAEHCEILLTELRLSIKTNAALATRLRQIEPELLAGLCAKHWPLTQLQFTVVRHAHALSAHLSSHRWINPNVQRYGPRTQASSELRARLTQKLTGLALAKNTQRG